MKNSKRSLIKTGIVIIIITFSIYMLVGRVLDMMPEEYVKDTAHVFVCVYLYSEFSKVYKKEKEKSKL